MHWFSNRGQIIQVVCAIIGAFVALMVWLAVPAQSLFIYATPVVVGIAVGIIISHIVKPPRPEIPTSLAPAPSAQEKPLTPIATPVTKPPLAIDYEIRSQTAAIGKRVEFTVAGRRLAVVVHGIKTKQKVLNADVEIIEGSGVLSGGPITERVAAARFLLPITDSSFHLEKTGTFLFERFEQSLAFIILNVDHIDPHAKEVTYTVCASKTLLSFR